MNRTDELEKKLEQVRSDIKALQANEEQITAELKEEKKPKLRHGDYGINFGKHKNSLPFPMLAFQINASSIYPLRVAHSDGSGDWESADGKDEITWLGNIFDDLKRNAEDLTEFHRLNQNDHNNFFVELSHRTIDISTDKHYFNSFTIEEAIDLHQKLGQMIATLKRKQNENS